jgi:hypothetical protein
MRTHTQLKIFFAKVLIGLATLTIVNAPAQVIGAGPSTSAAVVAPPQDARESAKALRVVKPKGSNAQRDPVSRRRGTTAANSSLSFLPAVPYDSGGNQAESVAVADLNGDGKPDVVVANICASSIISSCDHGLVNGSVGVLIGKGDGSLLPAVNYTSTGLEALSVAVADVNGDGKPDLIVANRYACANTCPNGSVVVRLGNGDGTFQGPVIYDSGGGGAWSVAVKDVNGDGKLDLVVANECGGSSDCRSSTVAVLLGKGDGTFMAAVPYDSGGQAAMSVAVADVNGDGKPDLLVANCASSGCASGTVGVLLGNGDGTFEPVASYSSGGSHAISIAVTDVNGDGKPDLLVANYYPSSSIGVLLGNGDGTFQAAVTYNPGGQQPISVVVADVNGDGKPDLLVANIAYSVGVLLGNGDGTFQAAVDFASGGNYPLAIAAADLNGDGEPDLVVGNISGAAGADGSVGVLLNNTVTFTTSTVLVSSLNPSTYGQKVTWTATVASSGSVTPTGTVKFTWSGHTIGSATLTSSGVASLTKSNLNADSYPLTAVYAGDVVNLGSTSAVLNQVVLQATSSATLTSSPNPSTQGQAVTFTATISSPTVKPTGPVTFTAGKTVLGTAQISGGKATLTISTLSVGSTKVTATYYGNSNIAKSSASVIETVH